MYILSIMSFEHFCNSNAAPIARVANIGEGPEFVIEPDPPLYRWMIKHLQTLIMRKDAYTWPNSQNPAHFLVYLKEEPDG